MKRALLICGIVVGSLLSVGPLWGMFGTVFGMQRAFHELAKSGVNDPEALSAAIGGTMVATFAGLIACPIGLILLVVCIIFLVQTKRQPPPLPPSGGVPASTPPS